MSFQSLPFRCWLLRIWTSRSEPPEDCELQAALLRDHRRRVFAPGGCRARARGLGGCCSHNLNLQSILIALRRRMKTAHESRQTLFTAARGNAENFPSARSKLLRI